MSVYIIGGPRMNDDEDSNVKTALVTSTSYIVAIVLIIAGFLAVNNICLGSTDRSKNIKLGLYALLLLSGGRIAWLYILLWILNLDLCR
jgi:hypothetical protein